MPMWDSSRRPARSVAHAWVGASAVGVVLTAAITGTSGTRVAVAAPAVQGLAYRFVEVPVLGPSIAGDSFSEAADINDAGRVVGYSTHPGTAFIHGFVWSAGGGLTELQDGLAGPDGDSSPAAVNALGVVAGHAHLGDVYQPPHAALWRAGSSRPVDLGTGYGSGSGSFASGINRAGVAVGGHVRAQSAPLRAALWTADGTLHDLGTLGGSDPNPYATESEAYDVNDAGQVVGEALPTAGVPLHGFLYQNGTMRDLGTLGGNGEATVATAINNRGVITGFSQNRAGHTDAFLWRNGIMRDLGSLSPDFRYRSSSGADVNDAGTVVGTASIPGGTYNTQVGFVWKDGAMRDLNTLVTVPPGRRIKGAAAISSDGRIAVTTCVIQYCEFSGGTDRAAVLVPR